MPVLSQRVGLPGRLWIPALLLCALAIRGMGCGDTAAPPQPAAVRIQPAESPGLLPGDSYQFKAIASDDQGSDIAGVRFAWHSSDTSVATVDGYGLVTATRVGSTEITASINRITARLDLPVLSPVATLAINPHSPMVLPGRTLQLEVTGEDSAGQSISGRSIIWQTSDSSIATISDAGQLSGLKPGSVIATATVSRKSASAPVLVLAPVAGLQVAPETITLHPRDELQLTATLTDAGGNPVDGRPVSWSVSDERIASISQSGLLRALRIGEAFVLAETEGQRDSARLAVEAPVASVEVQPNRKTLHPDDAVQLSATLKDADGRTLTGREITWATSESQVAEVSQTGLVTGGDPGTATVTATAEGTNGRAEITVEKAVATVTISPSSKQLNVGETFQFAATLRSDAGDVLTGREVTWSSERNSIVSVNSSGQATAVSPGTTRLEATSENVEGHATVQVSRPEEAPVVLVGAGDIATCQGNGDEETARILDTIPGTVFVAGDNVYPSGSLADYNNCYGPTWGRHKARTRPIPGNHEYETPGAAGYFEYFGSAAGNPSTGYYSYNLGGWHILALNTQFSGREGSAQADWVEEDLAAHPNDCTLAIWHVPVFSSDSSSMRFQNVFRVLQNAGAELVINGHEHNYQRYAPQTAEGAADPNNGLREFIVGTGGVGVGGSNAPVPNREVFYAGGPGVLKLTLHADSYDWKFIAVNGDFTDSGSASCH